MNHEENTNIPTEPGLWAVRAAAARRALAASTATFVGAFLLLAGSVLTLLDPAALQQPVGIGGPPLAYALVRPGLVFSGLAAALVLAAIAIDAARRESHTTINQRGENA